PQDAWLALRHGRIYAVDMERQLPKFQETLSNCLRDLAGDLPPEPFISHSRCDLCHWFSQCYQEAKATRHLSLLPGVTPARYQFLQAQRLTTVEALAQANPQHLAPMPGFGEPVAEKLVHQAQALLGDCAIPRQRTNGFPLTPTDLPCAEVELYFDIEAAPDQDLIYLHGVLVVDHRRSQEVFHALVAETPYEEQAAWNAFLELVGRYPEAPIYHFCPYEAQTVRKLGDLYGTSPTIIEPLVERFYDIHKSIVESVTLPIESYALKHIARWIGFDWRDPGANGAQSICWYNAWLETGDRAHLDAILRYNEDDCRATFRIKDWLVKFAQPFWNA
ncbi:recombinase B, partial [filamentous cyanobacterium CCP5]